MATQSQLNMLVKMCHERGLSPEPIEAEQAAGTLDNTRVNHLFQVIKAKPFVKRHATVGASTVAHQPVQETTSQSPKASVAAPEGFYLKDGEYYKVVLNRAGTRKYARILELVEVDGKVKPHWVYNPAAKGMVYQLTETDRITKEQAKAFGDLHHHCMCCGKELTVPLSVERGVGPVCWKRLGW